MSKYVLFVPKSTVLVGTVQKVKPAIQEELSQRCMQTSFNTASNPEFFKEGNAIDDFMKPDRVVVGVESEKAKEIMELLYKTFIMNNYCLSLLIYQVCR